jgi:type VI protein secretion system component Hcp
MTQKTTFMTYILYPVIVLLSLVGFSQSAEADSFIKFEGVDGESKDAAHESWVNILDLGAPMEIPAAGASDQSRRRGDATLEDMRLTVEIDSAINALTEAALTGEAFNSVKIDLCEGESSSICDSTRVGDQHCYMHIEIWDVRVSSYSLSAGDSPDRGNLSMTLHFEKFSQEYEPSLTECPADS